MVEARDKVLTKFSLAMGLREAFSPSIEQMMILVIRNLHLNAYVMPLLVQVKPVAQSTD